LSLARPGHAANPKIRYSALPFEPSQARPRRQP
jgi:hypothetical protein